MSGFFNLALKHLSDGEVDLDTDTIKVVAVNAADLGAAKGGLITGATNATPIVITSASHGLANGDRVAIRGVGGNTAANGVYKVANVLTNSFELTDPITGANVAGNGTYTSGGSWIALNLDDLADIPAGARESTTAAGITITLDKGSIKGPASFVLPAVTNGADVHWLVYYKDSGTEATSWLLYADGDDSGVPFQGNGQDVTVTPASAGIVHLYV